jgi:hypothetical protein
MQEKRGDTMTLQNMLQEIPSLTIAERKQLIHALVDSLGEPVVKKQRNILEFAGIGAELHSITELAGLGAETWSGVDAQEYINEIRKEWDERE